MAVTDIACGWLTPTPVAPAPGYPAPGAGAPGRSSPQLTVATTVPTADRARAGAVFDTAGVSLPTDRVWRQVVPLVAE